MALITVAPADAKPLFCSMSMKESSATQAYTMPLQALQPRALGAADACVSGDTKAVQRVMVQQC